MALERTLTTRELAEALEVTVRTVRRYRKQGMPCTEGGAAGNLYDLEEARRWLESKNLTGSPGRPPTDEGLALKGAKARLEEARAEKAELELARRKGELLRREEVLALYVEYAQQVRTTLLDAARSEPKARRTYALEFANRALDKVAKATERLAEAKLAC